MFLNKIILLLLFLPACTTVNSPTLSPEQVIPINVSDYPPGWYLASIDDDNDWHAKLSYRFQFASRAPHYLGSFIDFIQYYSIEEAENAYHQYRDRIFYFPGSMAITGWEKPADLASITTEADQFEIACIFHASTFSKENCTYWSQYDSCLIAFTINIENTVMTHELFKSLIHIINNNMKENIHC